MTPGRLRRTLGVGDAVTVGLGSMVGAGVFVVWGPATAAAGGWVLLALLLAGAVATCNALSSAWLAARHPEAGGTYVYGRERLGPLWGYLAGWSFLVGKTASCAAMAMAVGAYLVPGGPRVAAASAVVLVTALNLAGVQRSVTASRVVVTVVVCALLGVAVAAVLLGGGGGWHPAEVLGGPADPLGVLRAAGLIFFAFAGYARIATLGEEVRDPARTIPRAVVVALVVVLALYAVVGLVVLGVLGPAGAAASTDPVARVAEIVWPPGWAWVVRVAAGLAAAGALLNLVLGISRTALAMARDGHLPRRVAAVSGAGVPRTAELVVGVVVLAVVVVADLRGAIGFSSFGVLLYYAVANASAFTLRTQRPAAAVVPVVGLIGCVVLALSLPLPSVLAGSAVVLAGLGTFAALGGHRRAPA